MADPSPPGLPNDRNDPLPWIRAGAIIGIVALIPSLIPVFARIKDTLPAPWPDLISLASVLIGVGMLASTASLYITSGRTTRRRPTFQWTFLAAVFAIAFGVTFWSAPPPATAFNPKPTPSPTHTPSPTSSLGSAQINSPQFLEHVSIPYDAHGIINNVPEGNSAWLVVRYGSIYWPEVKLSTATSQWTGQIFFGSQNFKGQLFTLLVVQADQTADQDFTIAHNKRNSDGSPGALTEARDYPATHVFSLTSVDAILG